MKIAYIQKTTLIDYPGEIASTLFVRGCNFNCVFCYNESLIPYVSDPEDMTVDDAISFLKSRQRNVNHVVITGGEPTVQPGLIEFISNLKSQGFAIKLDTNGARPEILQSLLNSQLVDYVAMDIKSSPEHYAAISGSRVNMAAVEESITALCESSVPYEFRTTVWKESFSYPEFEQLFNWVKNRAPVYFLQNYYSPPDTAPQFTPFSKAEIAPVMACAANLGISLQLRGNWY